MQVSLRPSAPSFSPRLAFAAGLVGLFVAVPLIYIFVRALGADPADWQRLLQTRLWTLLGNTLRLAAAVTAGTLVLGVGLAFLTERTDLPGRAFFRWALALPLAIPPYIGAIIHLALMRPRGGVLPQALESWLGYAVPLPSPLGFWGAAFVLTLFTYPYVYLLSGAAFRSLHASLEESARTLGRSPLQTFWQVTLPVLRPGLLAGALLVSLDILAEYGTVALLRYETFSSAIFVQLSGRYDRSAAAVLSGVLVTLAMLMLWGEVRAQGQARFTQMEGGWRPAAPVALGRWRLPALMGALAVSAASLFVPLGVLTAWSVQAFADADITAAVFRTGSQGFGNFALNSLWTALLAAVLAVLLSLPVALFARRSPGRFSHFLARLCQVGYAIPGVVIALSLVLLVNRFLPFLYGTPLVVVMAYVLRHMPQAVRASQSALSILSPTLEEAARTLGRTGAQTVLQVTLPLILPGLLAGGALVFLTSLKELPATLLLRPAGFDTLAVRVWMWATDGFYLQAAPAALFLVLISIAPLAFLLRREQMFR
ncbi:MULTISPECIES: iron ABC transporter permease [Anaerolinea]|uniref:ABC transporter permease n=1 Tax=Anaerolinea TaxID=233189 RepID=UPI00260ECCF5|nr:iron ABC transporter permease [Anaerolinea thermophila]